MRTGSSPRRRGWRWVAAGRTRLRARWVLMPVLMIGACGLVVLAAHEEGFSAQAVDLGTGSVWVASNGPGQLALLDGASAGVTVKLRVAQDGDDVTAVTGFGAGYAVNRTTGTVLRVDSATWRTSDAHVLIDGSSAGLTAIAGDHTLFATDVKRGLAIRVDPVSLEPDGQPRSLSAIPGPGSPVLDSRGVLWLLDADKGNLIRMTDAPQTVQTGIAGGASGRLVLADDRPVVVDLAAGTATAIAPDDGSVGAAACVDVDPRDQTVQVVGSVDSNEVYTVSGADGVLRITNLDTGECSATVPGIAPPDSNLGQPVVAGRHVFVPDNGTGRVIVVDLDARTHTTTQALVDPGAAFELIGRDGFAFYNERASDKAGVVDTDGSVRTVAKYDVDDPGKGVFLPQPTTPVEDFSTGQASPEFTSGSIPSTDPSADGGQASSEPSAGVTPAGPDNSTGTAGAPTVPATGSASNPSTPSSWAVPLDPLTSTSPSNSAVATTSSTQIPTTDSPSESPPTSPGDQPTGSAPKVDAITITSFPNDGRFLVGDILTFGATVSGGTPDTWSWTLRYANDDGTPQAPVEHSSTEPTFQYQVNSGGSSFQKWIVEVTAANGAGNGQNSRVFQVDYVDGRALQVNSVNAMPNPVVTGTPVTIGPIFQGPVFSCQWSIQNGNGTRATSDTSCDTAQTAPGIGNYTIQVRAVSRQNTTATATQSLTVKNVDPPTVTACTPPPNAGALETAVVTATASGQVSTWHWKISRGNPLQDAGFAGDGAGSFSFTPVVADAYRAEVWVSNAGGDSAHQTCSFTVVDRTPPTHSIEQHGNTTTLTAVDPESAITNVSLTVRYRIVSGCTGEDFGGGSRSATAAGGTVSLTINPGSCLDLSPGAPLHSHLPNDLLIDGYSSSATSGGGTGSWND